MSCRPGPAHGGTCLCGTPGCTVDHHEPTPLDRLNVAEDELRTAERGLAQAVDVQRATGGYNGEFVALASTRVNAKAAHCMAAAARCLVTTDHTEG